MDNQNEPDWIAIMLEYVTGSISYLNLSEKYGIHRRTIEQRSKVENWGARKKVFKETTIKKTINRMTSENAKKNVEKLQKLQMASDNLAAIIDRVCGDVDQFNLHIVTERVGNLWGTECKKMEKIDTKAIKDISGSIKDLALVMRNLYDIPTSQERHAIWLANQRLKMDKEKNDVAGSDDDSSTGVVVLAPVLEEAYDENEE